MHEITMHKYRGENTPDVDPRSDLHIVLGKEVYGLVVQKIIQDNI